MLHLRYDNSGVSYKQNATGKDYLESWRGEVTRPQCVALTYLGPVVGRNIRGISCLHHDHTEWRLFCGIPSITRTHLAVSKAFPITIN